MMIWMTEEQAQIIARHALADSPNEACGIVGGVGSHVYEVIAAQNTAANPQHHYHMDERDLSDTLFKLQKAGMSIIAFYHSHPAGDFRPSLTDIERAYYPDTAYIIVGLRDGTPRMAAWQIKNREVSSVEIHVGLQPPDSASEMLPISKAQKVAIFVSALLAFIFMLVLSLSLLPPAPAIP
jgi:[CysO sulfur-carrier protein]-S-L-cysteine hydrolase